MKHNFKDKPRKFVVGVDQDIELSDFGEVFLDPDEQITFNDAHGNEYDVCKKDWGYYATPSLNGRLQSFNFFSALVMNKSTQKKYIMLVHHDKLDLFNKYIANEDQEIIFWFHKD
ncbi:hypothetical protein OAK21_06335 [Pseudomonadota bacterium]|nr:hypothetical protein [Euryarchaeota archaeon]MDC0181053.1 hypothetical protein [Pseudomonadota bacterium]|tara:strand:+ start:253 stop:597 length:345 start_codon:yes stop_codon:yes gene_type:complete